MSRSIPELSVDVKLLTQRLERLEPGELVSYDELTAVIARDVRTSGRGALASARRRVLMQDRMATECVWNQGVKRLSDAELCGASVGYVGRARRAARRGAQKLATIGAYEKLSARERGQHDAAMSVLGVMVMCSEPRKVKQIEDASVHAASQLPSAEVIRLLS